MNRLTVEQADELDALLERMMPGQPPEVRLSLAALAATLIESGSPNGNAYSLGPSPEGRYIIIDVHYADGRNAVQEVTRLQEENELLRAKVEGQGDS